ncbi:MAG: J domain-containing protein [Melioribacteraceae bacterium]|nr:J domain-containing protein [Melioribacteraceae bacterium]
MSNISGLRGTADYLFEQNKTSEASLIYNEIYRQIWNAIGNIHEGLNDFSKKYLPKKVMTSIEFRNNYTYSVATTVFYQWFRLDSDQVLNEFIFALSGHLKCVSYSKNVINTISKEDTLNEFLLLYTLVNYSTDESWIDQILKYIPPKYDQTQIDKARPNLLQVHTQKRLVKMSSQVVNTEWNHLNYLLVDYLINMGDKNSGFYNGILKSVGKRPSNSSNNHKTTEQYERREKKESYEKNNGYEKYERYEKFEKYTSSSNKKFDYKTASDSQKSKYYGTILELSGNIKKSEIRKKYLKLVGQYHPDKVESLGKDLRSMADERTKEINEAYEWIKNKHNL